MGKGTDQVDFAARLDGRRAPSKHEGGRRGFFWRSQSWYNKHLPRSDETADEITIGIYHPDSGGGTSGEFALTWGELSGKLTVWIMAYDDSWSALRKFGDVLDWMAERDSSDPSPDEVARALVAMGVEDMTQRTRPAGR